MEGSTVWAGLSDALLRGAHHELNNRIASLAAVEQVIAAGGNPTPALNAALVNELQRMRGAIALMGQIPSSRTGEPGPIRVRDALRTALAVGTLHHQVRDVMVQVEDEGDPPPTRVDGGSLQRSILVMLTAAARSLADAPEPAVRVECSADSHRIRLSVLPLELTEAERLAIAAWLRPFDGDLTRVDPRAYSISLPALRRS